MRHGVAGLSLAVLTCAASVLTSGTASAEARPGGPFDNAITSQQCGEGGGRTLAVLLHGLCIGGKYDGYLVYG